MTKRIEAIVMALFVTLSFQAAACQKDSVVYAEEKKEISIIIDGTALVFSDDDGHNGLRMGHSHADACARSRYNTRRCYCDIAAQGKSIKICLKSVI